MSSEVPPPAGGNPTEPPSDIQPKMTLAVTSASTGEKITV